MKRTRIIEVESNPGKCPKCGGKVVPILYGEPNELAEQEFLKGNIVFGGCCIEENDPDWECLGCEQQFRKTRQNNSCF